MVSRVPNRFFGIRDLAYFKAGIRDFEGKGERDSRFEIVIMTGTRESSGTGFYLTLRRYFFP